MRRDVPKEARPKSYGVLAHPARKLTEKLARERWLSKCSLFRSDRYIHEVIVKELEERMRP